MTNEEFKQNKKNYKYYELFYHLNECLKSGKYSINDRLIVEGAPEEWWLVKVGSSRNLKIKFRRTAYILKFKFVFADSHAHFDGVYSCEVEDCFKDSKRRELDCPDDVAKEVETFISREAILNSSNASVYTIDFHFDLL
jgi:hypothetical protein